MFVCFSSFDRFGLSIDLYNCLFIYLYSLRFVLCFVSYMTIYIHFLWSVNLVAKKMVGEGINRTLVVFLSSFDRCVFL